MSEYLIQGESLTALADEIRVLSGAEGTMGLDAMKSNVNTANSAVSAALSALVDKGVDVPDGSNVSGLAELIGMIESGGKVATGTFTPADTTSDITITHGFGEMPVFFIALPEDSYNYSSGKSMYQKRFVFLYKSSGATSDAYAWAHDTIGSNKVYASNRTYINSSFTGLLGTVIYLTDQTIVLHQSKLDSTNGLGSSLSTYIWYAIGG